MAGGVATAEEAVMEDIAAVDEAVTGSAAVEDALVVAAAVAGALAEASFVPLSDPLFWRAEKRLT